MHSLMKSRMRCSRFFIWSLLASPLRSRGASRWCDRLVGLISEVCCGIPTDPLLSFCLNQGGLLTTAPEPDAQVKVSAA